jgi:hypothetical protein
MQSPLLSAHKIPFTLPLLFMEASSAWFMLLSE